MKHTVDGILEGFEQDFNMLAEGNADDVELSAWSDSVEAVGKLRKLVEPTISVLENVAEQVGCTEDELLKAIELIGNYSPDTLGDVVDNVRLGNS